MEKYQQKFVFYELQAHDWIFERICKSDSLYNVALVAEDADVLECRIFFPQSKYFGFVGGDGYRSSEAGDTDEHVFVAEAVESFSKGVFSEEICFVEGFASVELIPVIIHIYNSNTIDIKSAEPMYQNLTIKQSYIYAV